MKLFAHLFLFITLACQCLAQNYTATWERIYPKTSPERRAYHSMVQISENRVLMFGGGRILSDSTNHFNDSWIFDLKDNSWTKVETKLQPSKRYGHAMSLIDSKNVMLFGGVTDHRDDFQRDVWYFNIEELQWKLILSDTSDSPSQFIYWPMCKISKDTVLIYGYDAGCCINHFYYNINQNKWYRDNKTHKMTPRSGGKFIDLNENEVFTFGGFNIGGGGGENRTWLMNKNTLDWKEIFPTNKPQKLYRYSMQKITDNDVFAFGGFAYPDSCGVSQQLWQYDYSLNNWYNTTPIVSPVGRDGHSIEKLNDSTFIMFSGMASCRDFFYPENDTWLLHFKRNVTSFDSELIIDKIEYKETQNIIQVDKIENGTIIQIFDILGNLVESNQFTNNHIQINKLEYPIGVYLIKIQIGNNTFTNKFIGLR